MKNYVRIELQPLGEVFQVERGTPLQDVLFEHGVEFPCGGKGRCKGCRVRVLSGRISLNARQEEVLSSREIQDGWRLACAARAEEDLVLEIAQWETNILTDESRFSFTPRAGLGIAVDVGTTTLVAQLVDLTSGQVRAVQSALNPQARFGGDIMTRVQHALTDDGREELRRIIHHEIGRLIALLLHAPECPAQPLSVITLAGNTVMHHLFCGLDVRPLSAYPFESESLGAQRFSAKDMGWSVPGDPTVCFLPCIGGFVGSDILAGILATSLHDSETVVGLVDLGTNGEIVIGNRDKMICASTAAGPAFEGARIEMGMRAATGAIAEVHLENNGWKCHVLGNAPARGLCGSGLVDAAAAGLELGIIQPSGRLNGDGTPWQLMPPVALTQKDIRELQLAKGAIAAGFQILKEQWADEAQELGRLYLSGAFGNYINRGSARRIGLLDFPLEQIVPAGNTSLLGAKLALFRDPDELDFRPLLGRIEHLSLSVHLRFQEVFAESMLFPEQ
ncbi:MAG: DUF4445 domain-containing protein [Phycisphaerales bacterium]|nr:DUF4445 domain-containing protein [Phycisphaerales bacterium]